MIKTVNTVKTENIKEKNMEENNEKKEVKDIKKSVIAKTIIVILIWIIDITLIVYTLGNGLYEEAVIKAAKPIIYIYPTEEMELSIKLGKPDTLLVSYPNYNDIWNVKAEPDGTLTEIDTNKKLYSLYYENSINRDVCVEKEGFVVEGKKTAEFLDKKLEILGLNYKEKEEFIIYWLPKLEANRYNYIRFMTKDEIEDNMPLEFSVQPDTLIRVNMIFKGLNKPIEVEEQQLEKVERNGFTVVEWGATEIK